MEQHTLIKKVRTDALETIQNACKVVRTLEQHWLLIEQLKTLTPGAHLWIDLKDVNFSIAGDREVLNRAFRILRGAGFQPKDRPEDGKPEFTTVFTGPAGERIYLSFSSTVCRRVKVRTEMQEVAIYEIRCGDDAVTAAPAPAEELPF